MINTIIFEDEIVLYWDKEKAVPKDVLYRISLNGTEVGITQKTHFRFTDLRAQTAYAVKVERLGADGSAEKLLFLRQLCTKKKRRRIDVTKAPYFAVGDGKTLNTQALQKALNDCKRDETVYFPAGKYLTGALDVHGNTELYLEKEAVLQGTATVEDYEPKRLSRFEGIEQFCYRPLLSIGTMDYKTGYTAQNVTIRGGGCILGGGDPLCWAVIETERAYLKKFLADNEEYVKTCDNADTIPGRVRPKLIQIANCRNVVIGNVTLGYAAAWNVHMIYSKNIVTYGCKIISKGVCNGDGWDPDSSEDCTVFNTEFFTHDDAVAIKSGKNPQGNEIARPTKNIRIFDCHGAHGVAIGSELSGGIENVFVWDCEFVKSYGGIWIKTTRKRGGYVRNLQVRNCVLADIRISTAYTCNDDGESSGELTELKDFLYEDVIITGVAYDQITDEPAPVPPIFLYGFEEKEHHIQNVRLKNVEICERKDGVAQSIAIKFVKDLYIEGLETLI